MGVSEGISRLVINGSAKFAGGGEIIVFVSSEVQKVYRGGRELQVNLILGVWSLSLVKKV